METGKRQERTKRRIPLACPSQLSASSLSNFCALLMYIKKMAPEESLYVGFSGAMPPVLWDDGCCKVAMIAGWDGETSHGGCAQEEISKIDDNHILYKYQSHAVQYSISKS